MNKVITIGREFGSGGRELGKRLSELLGYAYYDKEIVEQIAERTQLAESYVQQIVEQKPGVFFPITTGRTLHGAHTANYITKQHAALYAEQTQVLHDMASRSNCIIVGRCGDYILKDLKPLRLFVYADIESKVRRCREKAEIGEELTDRELERMIKRTDKNRARYYAYYTGERWGDHENYDLCINTSSFPVKELAELLAGLVKSMDE